MAPRAAANARLNLERELNDQDLAKIAADFSERYRRTAVRYTGDMNEIPQRLLMPSVHDANLWQVRVKVSIIDIYTVIVLSRSLWPV
jgi:transcription elongation factor SPT5